MSKIDRIALKIVRQFFAGRAKTNQEYKKIFQDKFKQYNYEFLNVIVINRRKYINYICPIHGNEKIRCDTIQQSQIGCKKCEALSRRMPISTFKQIGSKIHHNRYKYDKVNYTNLHDKVTITCPIHGDFQQRACSHIFESKGCKQCYQDSLS